MLKITHTTPEGNIVFEGDSDSVLAAYDKYNNPVTRQIYVLADPVWPKEETAVKIKPGLKFEKAKDIGNPDRKNWPKRIKPDKAANFLKDNSKEGIIAAFAKNDKQIAVLTKTYAGTGRYCFLSLTEATARGNAYMPEGEALDQVIGYMLGGFNVYCFKTPEEFFRYSGEYLKRA